MAEIEINYNGTSERVGTGGRRIGLLVNRLVRE